MRKIASIPPLTMLALGAVGFFLRKWALATALEPSGLPVIGARSAAVLLWFTLGAALISIIIGTLIGKKHVSDKKYIHAYAPSSGFFYLSVNILLACAMLTAAFLLLMQMHSIAALNILQFAFLILAVLTAGAYCIMAFSAYKKQESSALRTFSVIPSLFFCAWLILLYKDNAVNPALLDFGYPCVAISAAAISFYFISGYAFRTARCVPLLVFSLFTIFICTICLADNSGTPYAVFYAVTVLHLTVGTSVFIANLNPKET